MHALEAVAFFYGFFCWFRVTIVRRDKDFDTARGSVRISKNRNAT